MTKSELRKEYAEKRKMLQPHDRLKLDDLLLIQLQRIRFDEVESLFTYFPTEKLSEPNTLLFVDYMRYLFPDIKVACPKIITDTIEMEAAVIHEDTEYEEKTFGLTEPDSDEIIPPEEIDVIFVPLLAFDENGNRVGYGKGFYDRFLSRCREDAIKIGFSYFDAVEEVEDVDDYDIGLDYCITCHKIYAF